MTGRSFLMDRRGNAAVEVALSLPLLLALLFGGFELGYYMWSEHKVIEAVRNGARYASRLPITQICGTGTAATTAAGNVALMTRTGQLASTGAPPLVPGWTSNSQVSVTCNAYVSTGIYQSLGTSGQTVTVRATGLDYPSLFGALGIVKTKLKLTASSSTAVIGI